MPPKNHSYFEEKEPQNFRILHAPETGKPIAYEGPIPYSPSLIVLAPLDGQGREVALGFSPSGVSLEGTDPIDGRSFRVAERDTAARPTKVFGFQVEKDALALFGSAIISDAIKSANIEAHAEDEEEMNALGAYTEIHLTYDEITGRLKEVTETVQEEGLPDRTTRHTLYYDRSGNYTGYTEYRTSFEGDTELTEATLWIEKEHETLEVKFTRFQDGMTPFLVKSTSGAESTDEILFHNIQLSQTKYELAHRPLMIEFGEVGLPDYYAGRVIEMPSYIPLSNIELVLSRQQDLFEACERVIVPDAKDTLLVTLDRAGEELKYADDEIALHFINGLATQDIVVTGFPRPKDFRHIQATRELLGSPDRAKILMLVALRNTQTFSRDDDQLIPEGDFMRAIEVHGFRRRIEENLGIPGDILKSLCVLYADQLNSQARARFDYILSFVNQ